MKFGIYDKAQKAWLTIHETVEDAENALVACDVSSAVVAPYSEKSPTAPLPPEDGAPKEPQDEVVVHPASGRNKVVTTLVSSAPALAPDVAADVSA